MKYFSHFVRYQTGDAEKLSEDTALSASVSIETSLMASIQQTLNVNHCLSHFPYSKKKKS